MPEGTKFDTTDPGTLRPDTKPLETPGIQFEPMELEEKVFKITLPDTTNPNDPLSLWELYYTPEMINQIVIYTNNYIRKAQDPQKP